MKGYIIKKRKMSKKISDASLLLCAVAVCVYHLLKTLTHLEFRQLSEYNEDPVRAKSFSACSQADKLFSHQTLSVAIHTLKSQRRVR